MRKRLFWQWSIIWLLVIIVQSVAYGYWEDEFQEAKRIHELDALVKENPDKAVSELTAAIELGGPATLKMVAASHLGDLGSLEGVRVLEKILNKRIPAQLRIVVQFSLERIRLGLAQKRPEERKEVFQAMLKNPQWDKTHGEIMRVAGDLIELDAYSPRLQQQAPIAHYLRFKKSIQGIESSKERIDSLIIRLQDVTNLTPAESIALCALLIEEGNAAVPPLLSLLDSIQDKRFILVNDIADILISIGDKRALPPLQALASSPDPSISNKVAGHVPWLEADIPYPYKYKRLYGWETAGR